MGVDTYSQFGKNYIRPYPYQAQSGLPLERCPFGYAATATNQVLLFNSDVTAGYERNLTNNLRLNLIAGFNYQFSQQDFSRNEGQNLAPFIQTVSGASSTTFQLGYGLDRFNLSGYFGQATVSYKKPGFFDGCAPARCVVQILGYRNQPDLPQTEWLICGVRSGFLEGFYDWREL